MTLSLLGNFVDAVNSTLLLAQNPNGLAIRVASQASGVLGTLTAVNPAATPTWNLINAPAWLTASSVGNGCTLSFASAAYSQTPYEAYVSCTDEVSTVFYPIFIETRDPFIVKPTPVNGANLVVSGTTITLQSYDSTVPDIQILGYGLYNTPQTGVSYVIPPSLPSGLNFITSDGGSLVLQVQEPTITNAIGGVGLYAGSPTATTVSIQAYQPNSFYDTPERAYTLTLTITSLSEAAGTIDFGLGAQYNTVSNYLEVQSAVSILNGVLQTSGVAVPLPLNYHWSSTGPLLLDSSTSTSALYSITESGPASVTLVITDANSNPVLNGSKTLNFLAVSPSNTDWLTSAVKVHILETGTLGLLSESSIIQGYAGQTVPVTIAVHSADINSGESFTFTLSLTPTSSLEASATLSATSVAISSSVTSQTVNVTLPSNAVVGMHWILSVTTPSGTREGNAQAIIESLGTTPMVVIAPTPVSMNTGTPITAQVAAVSGATFELQGAPDGVTVNSSGLITYNVLTPGVYSFVVVANATGYAQSYSSPITLTVNPGITPLTLVSASSSMTAVPKNTPFAISWVTTGAATNLYLAQYPSPTPVITITGGTSVSVQQTATSVYAVYGTNFYGYAYSVPLVCTESSISVGGPLLPAPTIALIDDANTLTVNWVPYLVDGGYTIYRGWDILLTTGGVTTPILVEASSLSNTSSPSYTATLLTGIYTLNMVSLSSNTAEALNSPSWDYPHAFPTQLQPSSVVLSTSTVQLGQVFNVSLNPTYLGADMWRVDFPDNTSTGWIPLSSSVVSKSFSTTPSSSYLTVTTQRNYGTNNPPVYLRSSLEVGMVITPTQYVSPTSMEDVLTSTDGFAGSAGFEVTNSTFSAITTEPYEVIVRAIVRDTVTNELLLMLATSRYSNASSLLGTMAIDVFSMYGRPHVKELIEPVLALSTTATSSQVPVSIQTTALPSNCYVGKPLATTLSMTAVGGTQPYSWYAEGLPPGLEMNTNGVISGVPTQMGNFSVTFVAMDSSTPVYIAESKLTFTIPTDLVITTTTLPAITVGATYTCPLSNIGGLLPFTWSLVGGSLPLGISVNENTGEITGTPCTYNSTSDFTINFTPTIQVQDAAGSIATASYTCALLPMPLGFGLLDQTKISSQEDFKLVVPVRGGQSPYTLQGFIDSGVIGQGIQIINPLQISVLAGVNPAALSLTTSNQTLYPQGYPANIMVELAATGGVPWDLGAPTAQSYKFLVNDTVSSYDNTLPGAVVYGSILFASPTAAGNYTVTLDVVDSAGHYVTSTLAISCIALTSEYAVSPYNINMNGNTSTPSLWTLTPITAFPDATTGSPYSPGSGQYYALVLTNDGVPVVNTSTPPSFAIIDGNVPVGINFSVNSSANAILIFNGTPTLSGSSSFQMQCSGVNAGVTFTAAEWQSITSTVLGGGTTTVVAVTQTNELDIDLNMLTTGAVNNTYDWAYPLIAEGGTPPYTLSIISGTTLPGVNLTTVNNLPVFVSNTSVIGDYVVVAQATDSVGVVSAPVTIPVRIIQSTAALTHVLDSNLPSYWYVNMPITVDTYYVDADQVATWTASGLPTGVNLSNTIGTRVYLTGTPTTVSTGNSFSITATSVVYGTAGSTAVTNMEIYTQSAAIVVTPSTFNPIVGQQYRVINGSSFLSVVYTGYQPSSPNLPLLTNSLSGAVVGAPSLLNGGQPTTGNTNVTFDGFIMNYDYATTQAGEDVITLSQEGTALSSIPLTDVYSQLAAVSQTIAQSISEYTASAFLALPVQISGGETPYTVTIPSVGGVYQVSDSRFLPVISGGSCTGLQISASAFLVGGTYSCSIPMVINDSSGQSVSVEGSLTVTITQGTQIRVAFSNATWAISLASAEPYTGTFTPNSVMSNPTVGHPPYTYSVTGLSLPTGLAGFIQASPSHRVLAFNENETNTSISVADVDGTLAATGVSGTFTVTAVNHASTPTPGTYSIAVELQVVDSQGITSSATQTLSVVISD